MLRPGEKGSISMYPLSTAAFEPRTLSPYFQCGLGVFETVIGAFGSKSGRAASIVLKSPCLDDKMKGLGLLVPALFDSRIGGFSICGPDPDSMAIQCKALGCSNRVQRLIDLFVFVQSTGCLKGIALYGRVLNCEELLITCGQLQKILSNKGKI